MAPSLPAHQENSDGDIISRIYLIRHGDRFDYANPGWMDTARESGCLVTGELKIFCVRMFIHSLLPLRLIINCVSYVHLQHICVQIPRSQS
jgi:hypothetical protein